MLSPTESDFFCPTSTAKCKTKPVNSVITLQVFVPKLMDFNVVTHHFNLIRFIPRHQTFKKVCKTKYKNIEMSKQLESEDKIPENT